MWKWTKSCGHSGQWLPRIHWEQHRFTSTSTNVQLHFWSGPWLHTAVLPGASLLVFLLGSSACLLLLHLPKRIRGNGKCAIRLNTCVCVCKCMCCIYRLWISMLAVPKLFWYCGEGRQSRISLSVQTYVLTMRWGRTRTNQFINPFFSLPVLCLSCLFGSWMIVFAVNLFILLSVYAHQIYRLFWNTLTKKHTFAFVPALSNSFVSFFDRSNSDSVSINRVSSLLHWFVHFFSVIAFLVKFFAWSPFRKSSRTFPEL